MFAPRQTGEGRTQRSLVGRLAEYESVYGHGRVGTEHHGAVLARRLDHGPHGQGEDGDPPDRGEKLVDGPGKPFPRARGEQDVHRGRARGGGISSGAVREVCHLE